MTTQALIDLASRVRTLNASGPRAQETVELCLERLCDLSEFVRSRGSEASASAFLSAGHALESLACDDPCIEREPVRKSAAVLLQAVAMAVTKSVQEEARRAAAKGESDDTLLGCILIKFGHVTQEQLDEALAMGSEKGLAVGECLLLIGACPPERVLEGLRIQEQLRAGVDPSEVSTQPATPAEAPRTPEVKADFHVTTDIFLGEVLLGANMITNDELEAAMRMHHLEGVKVGEALVKTGALSEDELAGGVELQRSLQSIAQKTARPAGKKSTTEKPTAANSGAENSDAEKPDAAA